MWAWHQGRPLRFNLQALQRDRPRFNVKGIGVFGYFSLVTYASGCG